MKEREYTLLNVQFALFFNKPFSTNEIKGFAKELNEKLNGVFDQDHTINDFPDGPDFSALPILGLRSSGPYICNVAQSRVDFFILGQGDVARFDEGKEEYLKSNASLLLEFFEEKSGQKNIGRIGFIKRFFIRTDNPDEKIADVFKPKFVSLQEGKTYESSVTHVSRFSDQGVEKNHLVSLRKVKATIFGVGVDLEGIEFVDDINTNPEMMEDYVSKLDSPSIKRFISNRSESRVEELIELIFSDGK